MFTLFILLRNVMPMDHYDSGMFDPEQCNSGYCKVDMGR